MEFSHYFNPTRAPLGLDQIQLNYDHVPIECVRTPTHTLFKLKDLAVYSETAEGVKDLYHMIEQLPVDSEFGKYVYDELINNLKEKNQYQKKIDPKVTIFGWNKSHAVEKDAFGMFRYKPSDTFGVRSTTSIHIAQQRAA
jgi:hypothetical protein